MSHFTCIKTKIKEKDFLIKALNTLGYEAQENVLLENPDDHDHKQWNVEVAVTDDVGFKRSQDGTLELVAELDAWDLDVPVSRFIDKLTQQYAIENIKTQTVEKGYDVESEVKNLDGSVELVVTRWV
jgi:hypothetical protein